MISYFLLLGIPLSWHLLCYVGNVSKQKTKNISIILFFSILIILLGCRGLSVGSDTRNYYNFYTMASSTSFGDLFVSSYVNTRMEAGYLLLEKLFSTLSIPFNVFILFCSIIALLPLMILFYKKSNNPILVILLFTGISPFTLYFSGIRQVMAMGFGVIAFYLAQKRKLFPFLITVIIAFFFHEAALVLLVLYPLYKLRISSKWLSLIFGAALLIFIFGGQLLSFFSNLLGKYGRYEIASTGAYRMILLLLIFVIFCFFIPEKELPPDVVFLRNILCLCLVIQCFTRFSYIVTRVVYYFSIFLPLTIDYTIGFSKKKNIRLAHVSSFLLGVFFLTYFFIDAFFGSDGLNIYPYIPFWSN